MFVEGVLKAVIMSGIFFSRKRGSVYSHGYQRCIVGLFVVQVPTISLYSVQQFSYFGMLLAWVRPFQALT